MTTKQSIFKLTLLVFLVVLVGAGLVGEKTLAQVYPPTITILSPSSGPIDTQVVISGSRFTSSNNTVHFGYGAILNLSSNGTSITFTVPSALDPACRFAMPPCLMATMMTQPGPYEVSVSNSNGTSNSLTFAVISGTSQIPRDGTLILDQGTVYVIEAGLKRGIVSMSIFNALGYRLSNLVSADISSMSAGAVIGSAQIRHPRGTLVVDQGTVYLLGTDIRNPFPSAEVFFSWGNQFKDVVPANSYDRQIPLGSIAQHK